MRPSFEFPSSLEFGALFELEASLELKAPFDLEASSSVELEASLVMLATRWRVDIGTVSEVAPPPTPSKGHAVVTGKTPRMSQ